MLKEYKTMFDNLMTKVFKSMTKTTEHNIREILCKNKFHY